MCLSPCSLESRMRPPLALPALDAAHDIYHLLVGFYDSVRRLGTAVGLDIGGECICHEESLVPFLAELVRAGRTWTAQTLLVEWQAETILLAPQAEAEVMAIGPDIDVGTEDVPRKLYHAQGIFLLTLGNARVLVAGVQLRTPDVRNRRNALVFFGGDRSTLAAFLRAVRSNPQGPRVQIWGGPLRQVTPPDVAESDVILPPDFKADLLSWLDRFWRLRDLAANHRLPIRRGLLLVGAPGTGKTHLVRHLLTRYPEVTAHLFVAARHLPQHDPFGEMLSAVRRTPAGSMVILEDIDRMAESGMVTKEYLLNCLDGFLELQVPLLWVATSNDPTLLDRSLLGRPGRFDRTVVFPLPGVNERLALLRNFSTLPVEPDALQRAVCLSEGFSGAHLRQACASATLTSLDTDEAYGSVLEREVAALHRRHGEMRSLERGLRGGAEAGFRAG